MGRPSAALCVLRSFHVSRMACFSVYITDASFWNSEIWWQRPYLIYLTRAVDRLKHLLAKDAIHFLHWKQKVFLFYCRSGQCSFHNTVLPRKGRQAKEQRQNGTNFLTSWCSSYSTSFSSFTLHGHQSHLTIGIISWYLVYFFHFFFCQRCIFSLYSLKILSPSHVWSPKIKIGLYWNEW